MKRALCGALPVEIDESFIEEVRQGLPELPAAKFQRYTTELGIAEAEARALIADKATASFFESVIAMDACQPKLAANWIIGELFARLNKDGVDIESSPVSATEFAGLLQRLDDNTISGKLGKQVLDAMWQGEGSADDVIKAKGLQQITDINAIEALIDDVLNANPSQVAEFRAGKEKLMGFFVGSVMKASGGKVNPAQLNEVLQKKLRG